ncbi:MAG: hypothetical protein Q9176_002443 [Flavoplaca citrina]
MTARTTNLGLRVRILLLTKTVYRECDNRAGAPASDQARRHFKDDCNNNNNGDGEAEFLDLLPLQRLLSLLRCRLESVNRPSTLKATPINTISSTSFHPFRQQRSAMAPRRGGGSGGGSGVSSLEDTPWGQTTTLFGTDFQDAHIVARLVFQAIGLVGILVVIIAAKTFKKSHELNTKLFKWWAFWLSALALFVAFAIAFIDNIMSEAMATVQVIYYLIATIIFESAYLAEISLLLVLYILLPYCTLYPNRTGQKPRIAKMLKICHAIFLFILVVLWLAMLALRIQSQVEIVIGDPWVTRSNSRSIGRIWTAYAILYFFGSLEILAWSLLSLIKKRTEHGRTTLYTLALIAAPLLLRSTYMMGYVIHAALLQKIRRFGGKRLLLASEIIYNLTTILIYAGIVVIARYFSKTTPAPGANPTYGPNDQIWNDPNTGNAKPNMAVHESAPPPVYQQGNFQPTPSPIYNQPAHGQGQPNPQYTVPSQHTQYHQPYLQNQTPWSGHQQQQQQQQQPYPLQGYYSPQQQQQMQPIRTAQSPPPMQGQMSPVMQSQQQHRPAPSEVSGVTGSTELPSSNGVHAR